MSGKLQRKIKRAIRAEDYAEYDYVKITLIAFADNRVPINLG